MSRIWIEQTEYRSQAIIKMLFGYDATLIAEVRSQLPDARWSRTMRCWSVLDTPETVAVLSSKFDAQGLNSSLSARKEVQPLLVNKDEQKGLLVRFSGYMKERRYSPRTIESYVECLRIFFDFLDWKNILDKHLMLDRIERPRRGRPLPRVISKDDVARIINATGNLKHRAMLSLLYSCGLWRSELLDMCIIDIDSKRNVVNIRRAKGDKDRQVPLSPKVLELLREYFKQYRPIVWLFEGEQPGTPYAAESLHKVFTVAKHKAGITIPFKLHGLRHCYATHLMEAGVGLRYIQELLGHRYVKTTKIYLHVSSESIRKIQSPFDTLDL